MTSFIYNLYSKLRLNTVKWRSQIQFTWLRMAVFAATCAVGGLLMLRRKQAKDFWVNMIYGIQPQNDKEINKFVPLKTRCLDIRKKIHEMCTAENAALVFTVTDDTVIMQSQIPFIC